MPFNPNPLDREGALGALIDEYERAVGNLCELLGTISQARFEAIADPNTSDPDCVSIQTVVRHVLRAGYGYARYIQKALGQIVDDSDLVAAINTHTPQDAIDSLQIMFDVNVQRLYNENRQLIEAQMGLSFTVPWNEVYNIDQLLEHAVMHVLRHRRQISRFLNLV